MNSNAQSMQTWCQSVNNMNDLNSYKSRLSDNIWQTMSTEESERTIGKKVCFQLLLMLELTKRTSSAIGNAFDSLEGGHLRNVLRSIASGVCHLPFLF
eukprot:Awhi_evm1s1716